MTILKLSEAAKEAAIEAALAVVPHRTDTPQGMDGVETLRTELGIMGGMEAAFTAGIPLLEVDEEKLRSVILSALPRDVSVTSWQAKHIASAIASALRGGER